MNREKLIVLLVFLAGFTVRFWYVTSDLRIPFDYDQYEDLILTKRIVVDRDLPVIGRPIYGDPRLHHGVVFFYYNVIPFVLFDWNPVAVALWISLFNTLTAAVVYYFSFALFRDRRIALASSIIVACSYEYVQFSSWISSTTLTVFAVPIAFYGLWLYFQGRERGLWLSALFLGLSIQAELFFLYLIAVFGFLWLVLDRRLPRLRTILAAGAAFGAATATMVLTELKLGFAGVKTLMNFGATFDDSEIPIFERFELFLEDLAKAFALNVYPAEKSGGKLIIVGVAAVLLYGWVKAGKGSRERRALLFLMIYLLSPVTMLVFGYHRQPWFLIGALGAVALSGGYAISRLRWSALIGVVLIMVIVGNVREIADERKSGTSFFRLEESAVLTSQLEVVDWIYREAGGEEFGINTITYPMHHNALWAYHFTWYGGKRYGYLPGFMGAEQVYPYDFLPRFEGGEKLFFLIMDKTVRIPEIHRENAMIWAKERGVLIGEKETDGFIIQKFVE